MADSPADVLQRIYNEIDTAETAWIAYKATCIPEFDGALDDHKNALVASKQSIQAREEQAWQVLSFLLGVGLGVWVPKFLKPVGTGIDELTAGWVQETLNQFATEDLKDVIKGTTLEKLKLQAVRGSLDAFEPVVEKTIVWGSRLEEGILKRSLMLKNAINEVKRRADSMKLDDALKMEQAFMKNCPFLIDKPTDMSEAFKKKFRIDAELEMWARWARERDKQWWQDHPQHRDLWDMWPIMNRMFALGVTEVGDWHPGRRSATIGGNWIKPGYLLNMTKLIEWAERRWRDANTCKAPMVIPDFLKFPANRSPSASYPVGTK